METCGPAHDSPSAMGDSDHGFQWDDGVADSVAEAFTTAAGKLDAQAGSRQRAVARGMTDFEGNYSRQFKENGQTASGDREEIATALRQVKTLIDRMKEAAAQERENRRKAREWDEAKKNTAQQVANHVVDGFIPMGSTTFNMPGSGDRPGTQDKGPDYNVDPPSTKSRGGVSKLAGAMSAIIGGGGASHQPIRRISAISRASIEASTMS